ncbi:MAG: succinate dehydrogenase, cytochrome b556 subunit [Gammaproteobacteria bacterium]|nr:succinate dehydrogenase, cytochrome b556 subunit [Gammaproteobacteria bacterium]
MANSRPVFLDLWRIRLPIPGVVSILHRVSGVLLVLAIPVFAVLFAQALSGPNGFGSAAAIGGSRLGKLVLLVLSWALLHHLLAGLRYLALDIGWGLDRPTARKSAWATLYAAIAVTLAGAAVLL